MRQLPHQDLTNPALFQLTFDKIPDVTYYSYSVNLPGVTLGEAIQPTPFHDHKVPGDKLTFDPLVVNFIVQENLANWLQIFDWMVGLGHPESLDQTRAWARKNPNISVKQNRKSDAQLIILSNKSNPILKVTFQDAFPISLSPLTYDASITDSTPISTDATFSYTYYTIETL
jgi:hypothetical protein